jgi:hypothetical protein
MIEVLIAMVVVSIGLLGVAALQTKSLQSSGESEEISIATIRASDLGERLWAMACQLANADDANSRIAIATRVRNQWIKDHNLHLAENQSCQIPDCCDLPVCFIDPATVSLPKQEWVFIHPGASANQYTFRIPYTMKTSEGESMRGGVVFTVVLPPQTLFEDCK